MRTFIIKPGDLIPIGRAGENQATQIRFDVTGWADTFGAGTYTLVVKRPHEDTAYPVEVTTDGDYVVWTVSNVDTGIAGNASVQLRYVVDGALAKSVIYTGIVGESLDNIVDPPDPFEDLIQRMVDLAERTEAAAESAAGSATSASESAGTATAAKNAAQTAAQAAQTAQGTATQAAQTATQAKDAAQEAQQAAEAAQTTAAQSATAASGSATAAAGSATQAAASATAAAGSAAAAAQSAAAAQAAATDVIDKAPVIVDTASGAIASFPDGSAAPIKQLTVNIEPQQDLHGYDNPWPAGGGKNKFDKAATDENNGYMPLYFIGSEGTPVNSANYNISEYIQVSASTTYTISPATGSNPSVCFYDANKQYISGEKYMSASALTFTTPANASYLRASIPVANVETFQLELGSTATAYAPYSNHCPITGWTGANVGAAGKNLLSMKAYSGGSYNPTIGSTWNLTESVNQFANPSAGVYTINFTSSWGGVVLICPVIQGQTYRFSYTGNSTANAGRSWGYLDENFKVLSTINSTDASFSYNGQWAPGSTEATKKAAYIFLLITPRTSSSATITINNPQIEFGSTAADFAPYAGTSYPITWQSEAGTVYGGHWIAHQDGSVTLVADRAYVDLGSFDYTRVTGSINVFRSSSAISGIKGHATASGSTGSICEKYVEGTSENIANGKFYIGATIYSYSNKINIRDDSFTDADLFKTSVTGTKLVYPLATPITYTLTAAEMSTLLGQNNWWADCGDIENIEYRADTKLYIDKKLAALVAALS